MSVMEEKHCSQIAQHQNLNSNSVQGIFKNFVSPPTRPSVHTPFGGFELEPEAVRFHIWDDRPPNPKSLLPISILPPAKIHDRVDGKGRPRGKHVHS